MSANFTTVFGGYREPGAFKFWCQKVLPLVYDDSLSYYELLCKVVDYINNLIHDNSQTIDNMDALLTAYNQLQDYVNTYFDNLDLTGEVSDKIDEMADNGELLAVIQPTLDAMGQYLVEQSDAQQAYNEQTRTASEVYNTQTRTNVENAISEQNSYNTRTREITEAMVGHPFTANTSSAMTDQTKVYVYTGTTSGNFINGHWYYYNNGWVDGGVYNSQGINTDTTLTISGMAADAKATGDQITFVKQDNRELLNTIDYNDDYYIGLSNLALKATWTENYYLNDSGEETSYNGLMYSGLLPVEVGRYSFLLRGGSSSNAVRVHGYDSNGDWVSMLFKQAVGGTSDPYEVVTLPISVPSGISYIRLSLAMPNLGTVPKIVYAVYKGTTNINTRLSNVENNKLDRVTVTTLDFTSPTAGYVKPDGTTTVSGNWKHIVVNNVKSGTVITTNMFGNGAVYGILAFDENGTFISGVTGASSEVQDYTYTMPDSGTVYINYSSSYSASGEMVYVFNIDKIISDIDSLENQVKIPFLVMLHKIGVCGDSLSSGEIWNGSSVKDCYAFSWLSNICRTIDAESVHYSKGGMTSKSWWLDDGGYKTALANETNKPVAYYVAFGTNDKNQSEYPIGTITDVAGTDTFVGYMRSIIEYVHTNQPNAIIFLVTTYNNSSASTPYNEIIEEIAGLYSYCLFIDYATNAEVMTTQTDVYVENSHFTTVGYVRVANTIKALTEKAIESNLALFKHFGLANT